MNYKQEYDNDGWSDVVWICHTNWGHRVIPPTKGRLKKPKHAYLGPSFHKLKGNGTPYAKSISYTNAQAGGGTNIEVFNDYHSCAGWYINECDKQIKHFTNLKEEIIHGHIRH